MHAPRCAACVLHGCVQGDTCVATGDPRYFTFDGTAYSFQGAGDFFLFRGLTTIVSPFSSVVRFDVQIRTVACSGLGATCIRAIAMSDGTDTFELYAYSTHTRMAVGPVQTVPFRLTRLCAGDVVTVQAAY
jgi:hypothetical protein